MIEVDFAISHKLKLPLSGEFQSLVFYFLTSMAESFLFSIAESLIAKLASRAYEEASQVLGVYDSLQHFKDRLSYVKEVLLDAEDPEKQQRSHQLKEWVRQIKHFFSDAENVLDEFECETLRKQVLKAHGSTKDEVSNFFSSSSPLVFRYRMAKQIKDINKRLDELAADRNKFGLQIIEVDRRVVHRREMTYSHVNDSNVIGRDHDREKIIELLMQQIGNNDDKSLSIIPIVGIGGLGKTTLAKFVFNDKRVQKCFQSKMWVCISDEFDIKQVIIKIINSANESLLVDALGPLPNFEDLDIQQLQNYLRNKLANQKFLLVLDDVWNQDRGRWLELRDLISSDKDSKILVTTRSHSIASMMGTVPAHVLQGLSLDDSLFLFVKSAFKEGEEKKHPNLINIGRDIVKKCGGVPLAVKTLGSLLFSKYEADEWKHVRDNEIWSLLQKEGDILPVLKLSFDRMPSYLKQCFALFSLYPKDYVFTSFEVTFLWGALGLLSTPVKNKTLEDVAMQYLDELQSRSFILDFLNFGFQYQFKIHDLMHDLTVLVAKDECLYVNSSNQNIAEKVRHLSFAENVLPSQSLTSKSVGLRTIIFPNAAKGAKNEALLNTWLLKFKYLRFLDLNNSTFESLPHSIGKLKHLRYFSISYNRNIKRLPDAICKLQSLETLRFSGCTSLEALPKGLKKLISLRHLEITTKQSVFPDHEIAALNSLEILYIHTCHNVVSMMEGVTSSTLKKLAFFNCQGLNSLPMDFKCFPELDTLAVSFCNNLDLEQLKGQDEQRPKLKLKYLRLLGLPQLVSLPQWLEEAANTLQSLSILGCNNLEVLPEWLSIQTNLKTLLIENCPKILSLPDNFHPLTTLESLAILNCPELCRKCQPQVGEYWPKISHIKHIQVHNPEELEELEELEKE